MRCFQPYKQIRGKRPVNFAGWILEVFGCENMMNERQAIEAFAVTERIKKETVGIQVFQPLVVVFKFETVGVVAISLEGDVVVPFHGKFLPVVQVFVKIPEIYLSPDVGGQKNQYPEKSSSQCSQLSE